LAVPENRKELQEKDEGIVAENTKEPNTANASDEKSTSNVEQNKGPGADTDKPNRSRTNLWIAVGVGVAAVLFFVISRGTKPKEGQPSVASGATPPGDLTLQTADRDELDCSATAGIQNYQCGFIDEKQTRNVEERQKLRPFMTGDRTLYLIPGLFLDPAINQRYNAEPPKVPRDQLKRFTAKCTIKILGELDGVKLRWSPTGTWEPPKKFPVATASDCKIEQ
jgi:hypothetical protein